VNPRVTPINPALGAEVHGFEPGMVRDSEVVRELREAFDDRGLLVFRGLDIDEATQRTLVFTLISEPQPDGAERTTIRVSNKEENGAAPYGRLLFHCDNMWARKPQPAISLYGLRVEQPSAPTRFAGMRYAWQQLPSDLRARLEGLEGRHGFDEAYPNRGGDEDVIDAAFERPLFSIRPVGFRHPRTDHTLLYVSQQATIEVLGLTDDENERLLADLFARLYEPALVYSHEWQEGDLVVWDNIAVQHARDKVVLDGPERTLRKVTGPVNIDPDELVLPLYSKIAGA
jgi:taurine dioxygenase